MIVFMGHKVTANELAKLLVEESGSLSECWHENHPDTFERMTELERTQVNTQLERQLERIRSLLGFWDLRAKVFARPVIPDQTVQKSDTD